MLRLHFWSELFQNKNSDLQQFVPGVKKKQNGKEKGQTGVSVRSPVLGHFEEVHGSLTRFVHIGSSLRKLVHGCADPRLFKRRLETEPFFSTSHSPLTHSLKLRSRVLFCILSSEMILDSQVLVEIGFVQDWTELSNSKSEYVKVQRNLIRQFEIGNYKIQTVTLKGLQ